MKNIICILFLTIAVSCNNKKSDDFVDNKLVKLDSNELIELISSLNSKVTSLYSTIDSLKLISHNQASEISQLRALLQNNSGDNHSNKEREDYSNEIKELKNSIKDFENRLEGKSSSFSSTDRLFNLSKTIEKVEKELSSIKSDIKSIENKIR